MMCLLASCDQVRPEDRVCKLPAVATNVSGSPVFASGYFPPEYGRESISCFYMSQKVALISEVESDWFPSQWKAACEPSFFALANSASRNEFKFRFSYLPSFDHPIFITVQSETRGLVLIAKQLTGVGGYDPGMIGRSKELVLTGTQSAQFRDLLDKGGVFTEAPGKCDFGLDRTYWIFEQVHDGRYQLVKRRSPNGGAPRELGDWLLQVSGLPVRHN